MFKENSIGDFMEEVSCQSPAPGGGSIAALSAAAAAALVTMVANLTFEKKGYEQVKQEMELIRQRSIDLRATLLNDIDRDSDAYMQVVSAYKLPKGTESELLLRKQTIQTALKGAATVPLGVAERGVDLFELATTAIQKGNKNCRTDGSVAILMARSAVLGALLNVKINLPDITDRKFVDDTLSEVRRLENCVQISL